MRARTSGLMDLCNMLIFKCSYKGHGFDLSFMHADLSDRRHRMDYIDINNK